MTVRYVDATYGNDGNSGLTPALAKATLNGAENTPVVAGDIIHVAPGVYRELLTVDVSGSIGSPIEYRGDPLGLIFGRQGIVRITGSDNDTSGTRANCISSTGRDYRSYTNLFFDSTTNTCISLITSPTAVIFKKCVFQSLAGGTYVIVFPGTGTGNIVDSCFFIGNSGSYYISITHTGTTDNSGDFIQNCIFMGGNVGLDVARVGGVTVRNNLFVGRLNIACRVSFALNAGQVMTVNNNVFSGNITAISGTATTDVTENYNTFFGNSTDRTNTNTGANSVSYPPLFNPWWFYLLANASTSEQIYTPFDLSSYSQLINLAGTSPTTTDARGQSISGSQREFGALEYDPVGSGGYKTRGGGVLRVNAGGGIG